MFLIPQLPPPTFKQPDKWSAACNAWLARALKKDPKERPDAATLLQDPFMQEGAKLTAELLLELFSRAKGRVRIICYYYYHSYLFSYSSSILFLTRSPAGKQFRAFRGVALFLSRT